MAETGTIRLIYYYSVDDMDAFFENISNNYPNKKIPNGVLIYTSDTNVEVFDKITSKDKLKGAIAVIAMESFWGRLPVGALEWVKSRGINVIEDPSHMV
jgi:hypothetical protein